jgi:hypothetical protein
LGLLIVASAAVLCFGARDAKAAGSKAARRQFPVADPAFMRRVTARWNRNSHTDPKATITSLKFETVVRTDCVYEIRTRTDPDPAALIVAPKPGGDLFMSLGG